jgi:Holliday junction resolvase RusA-like endonuclease
VRKSSKFGKSNGESGRGAYRAVMYEQEKYLKPWRASIKKIAEMNKPDGWKLDGCFANWSVFFFPRPKYHYDSREKLKPQYRNALYKTTKPDGDKCLRAVNDAITGVIFNDDALVGPGFGMTAFADPGLPGALITVVKLC